MKEDSNTFNFMTLAWCLIACLVVMLTMLALKRDRMSYFTFNDGRLYCTGMLLYALDNQNRYPTNLSQTLPYLWQSRLMPNRTNGFEILFHGSINDFSNSVASRIIVMRSEAWLDQDRKWARIYGFADGHCETHSEPRDNFDDWESQHSVVMNRSR
jgi:hypothetical protein